MIYEKNRHISKINQILSISIVFVLISLSINLVGAQTDNKANTFRDAESGISFQYPSDWYVASNKYIDKYFEDPQ